MCCRIALIPVILLLATTKAAFAEVSPLKDPVTDHTFTLITDRGIRVSPAGQPGAHDQAVAPAAALSASDTFLRANREAVGWTNPGVTLAAAPLAADDLGESHIRYYQYYRGQCRRGSMR